MEVNLFWEILLWKWTWSSYSLALAVWGWALSGGGHHKWWHFLMGLVWKHEPQQELAARSYLRNKGCCLYQNHWKFRRVMVAWAAPRSFGQFTWPPVDISLENVPLFYSGICSKYNPVDECLSDEESEILFCPWCLSKLISNTLMKRQLLSAEASNKKIWDRR